MVARFSSLSALRMESARGTQPSQNDLDETADGGLRGEAGGCRDGMEAVARKLVRSGVIAELAGPLHSVL
jgi:hypothetical protein